MLAHHLAVGDRAGIWAPNCVDWMLVQYATAKAGIVLVNVNPAYRTSELEYALNQSGCRRLFAAPEHPYTVGLMRSVADASDGDWLDEDSASGPDPNRQVA